MGENDGVVQQEQFSEWAMSHPQVLVLFAQLSKIVSLIEKKKLARSRASRKSAAAPAAGPRRRRRARSRGHFPSPVTRCVLCIRYVKINDADRPPWGAGSLT